MRPAMPTSKPSTRTSPASEYSLAAVLVRALVFSIRNSAEVSDKLPFIRSHFPPSSTERFFSGSWFCWPVVMVSCSSEGLNEVPGGGGGGGAAGGGGGAPGRARGEVT